MSGGRITFDTWQANDADNIDPSSGYDVQNTLGGMGVGIWVGALGGDVVVVTKKGTTCTFTGVPANTFLPMPQFKSFTAATVPTDVVVYILKYPYNA